MKNSISIAIVLIFAFSAISFGLAFAEEIAANATENAANETEGNNSSINATLENATPINETLENATLNNESLENTTLNNDTLDNLTASGNDTNPFANVKGRQPTHR